MTDTGQYADYVLPDCMPFERYELVAAAAYNHIVLQEPAIEPQGEAKDPTFLLQRAGQARRPRRVLRQDRGGMDRDKAAVEVADDSGHSAAAHLRAAEGGESRSRRHAACGMGSVHGHAVRHAFPSFGVLLRALGAGERADSFLYRAARGADAHEPGQRHRQGEISFLQRPPALLHAVDVHRRPRYGRLIGRVSDGPHQPDRRRGGRASSTATRWRSTTSAVM